MDPREKLFQTVTDRAPIVLFAVDADAALILCEGKDLRALGLAHRDVLGQSILELYKDYPDVSEPMARGLQGEEVAWTVEIRGSTFDVFVTPMTGGGLVGVARDVTGHRETVTALQASEAKFAAAFRHSPDSVLLTAVPSGEILEVNRGFTLITGFERKEAVGKTTLELGLWADPEERDRMFAQLRADGRVAEQAVAIRRRSGEVRQCRLWGEVLPLPTSPTLLTVVRDVTEQQQVELERAAAMAELEAKNRELERFSLAVAHDLKAPLVSIRGLIHAAEEDLQEENPEAVSRSLRRIEASATRMVGLLDSLLQLSRQGRVLERPEIVDMSALAREAVELLAALVAEKKAKIEIREPLGTAIGDRERLLQVWQNLVSNGIKFGGVDPPPKLCIGRRTQGGRSVFWVRDRGAGLASEDRLHIFELFGRRSREGVEGTGVGLALVKRIVEAHGGKVWAESDGPGRGSTFCFTLAPTGEPGQ